MNPDSLQTAVGLSSWHNLWQGNTQTRVHLVKQKHGQI